MTPHLVPLAFLLFLTVCAVAGIVADYKKRRVALEPLRAAIERGQQLDPAVIERLMTSDHDRGFNPVYLKMGLKIGGIIILSLGVGIAILAFILTQVNEARGAFFPVLGGATVVLCLGAGLMIAARALERQQAAQSESRQQVPQPRQGS
jgi:hypothetical protein